MLVANLKPFMHNGYYRFFKSFSRHRSNYERLLQTSNGSSQRFYGCHCSNVKFLEAHDKQNLLNRIPVGHLQKRFQSSSSLPPAPPQKVSGVLTWKSVLVTVVIGSVFAAYIAYLRDKKKEILEKNRTRGIGKASLGGQFELVNQYNQVVKNQDLLGKWVLIYFGFTHCPDVCPDELEKIVKAVDTIDSHKGKRNMVVPVFISVDPERDSPAIVGKYISEFSPKFIGLTGTRKQIESVTKGFRVYYSAGPRDTDNDYIVDHTIITYFIGPDGEFIDYFSKTTTAEQMANEILKNMGRHEMYKSKGILHDVWDWFQDITMKDNAKESN